VEDTQEGLKVVVLVVVGDSLVDMEADFYLDFTSLIM